MLHHWFIQNFNSGKEKHGKGNASLSINSSPQNIEVRVGMYCAKCKTQVLKAVTKLEGIDQITLNEEKGLLTVVGSVDPVLVIKGLRKQGKVADIISVGPPKKPDPPPKPQPQPQPQPLPLPISCNDCRLVAFSFIHEPYSYCTIL